MAINKVVYKNRVLIDLTDTTAVAADVASDKYFYLASGEKVIGTGSGGSVNVGTKTITANGTYDAGDDSLDGYSEVTVNVPDPADYTSASTALGISKPITSGIEALTTYANGVTGESDINLSDAVYSLAQGYGSGGDYVAADFADRTKPTGAVTFLQSSMSTAYFARRTGITKLYAPNFTTTGNVVDMFREMTGLQYAIFPKCVRFYNSCFYGCTNLVAIDCTGGTTGGSNIFMNCRKLDLIILRKSDGIAALNSNNAFNGTPFASGKSGGTIYIPKALYDHLGDGGALDYKAAKNWSTYNGYGTITWAKIEGSQYETHYADGTEIPTS